MLYAGFSQTRRNWQSEVMRGPGSISIGGNILSLDCFHVVKPLMPILALLSMLCVCENPDYTCEGIAVSFVFLSLFFEMLEVGQRKRSGKFGTFFVADCSRNRLM